MMLKLRTYLSKFGSHDPRTFAFIGDNYACYIKLCGDIKGRWEHKGVKLPRFGSSDETKENVKILPSGVMIRVQQRVRRWWIPYFIVYTAQNTEIEVTQPEG